MSNLEIIGAGFGRTGTHSLYLALNKLGYKTHHMVEVMRDETGLQDPAVWTHAYDHPNSPETNWSKVYSSYTAAVDFPTCSFYEELMALSPNAKVILTVRSAESWYKSVTNTIFKFYMKKEGEEEPMVLPGHMGEVLRMMAHTAMGGLLERDSSKLYDKEYMCRVFDEHVEQVKKTVPAERLLVLELGHGWEPLCEFLGKPIPDEPYPVTNSTEEFQGRSQKFREELKASAQKAETPA
ncbi:P-loop containing nucleoside triphosphate hydrolase protein [Gongronella butleri]|nr:P-loop containing nucleoside triphosphate hydrolase protein [Gongronella butleri]